MAGAATRPAAQAPAVHGGGQFRTIVLLNGTRLVFGPAAGGARIPAIVPPARGQRAGALLALDLAGRAYDIPQAALPYLGRGLDPDLFMVSSLLREESAGRLPVTITYTGRTPALPGVTITHAGGGTARAYLTPAGAAVFGVALARQFAADHARGSYGQDGLFAGGVSIRLAAAPATARAAPAFPMHTLTVTGTNLTGRPDIGDYVLVFNADSSSRFGDPLETVNIFDKGVAKFSLPAGHYWAVGEFPLLKKPYTLRLVVLPQFTVAQNAAVHMAERAAGWGCQMTIRGTAAGGRSCAVEPLLTLQYAVAGESLHGSTHAGPQTVHLSVGHLQLVNGARVTRAALSVSVNGGKTWHRAKLTGHGGSYTATFTAPAGVQVSLCASAADAAGGTISETLPGAYQVAP
jgi:hypothetical protein